MTPLTVEQILAIHAICRFMRPRIRILEILKLFMVISFAFYLLELIAFKFNLPGTIKLAASILIPTILIQAAKWQKETQIKIGFKEIFQTIIPKSEHFKPSSKQIKHFLAIFASVMIFNFIFIFLIFRFKGNSPLFLSSFFIFFSVVIFLIFIPLFHTSKRTEKEFFQLAEQIKPYYKNLAENLQN